MEAVGAAAAIIQLAGVGLALAKSLYGLYDEGTSGNEQVKELSFYVRSTSIALEEVGKVFEEESKAIRPLLSKNAITTANDVVSRCTEIFKKLGKMADDGRKNTIGLLLFPFKSSSLRILQTRLEQSKIDLQLMMQVIIYARLRIEPRLSVNEAEQRKAVGNLIDERGAIYERYTLAEEQAALDSDHELQTPPASSSPEGPSQHNAGLTSQNHCTNDVTASSIPAPQPDDNGHELKDGFSRRMSQSRSVKAAEFKAREADVSYWSALYLVCCPCLTRKRDIEVSRTGISPPSNRSSHTYNLPSCVSHPPQYSVSSPSSPATQGMTSYRRPGYTPSQAIYELEAEVHPTRLSHLSHKLSMESAQRATHESEIDRLLRQWTTLFNVPSIVQSENDNSFQIA